MKKLVLLGMVLLYTALVACGQDTVLQPGAVGTLLIQKLDSDGKSPGALEREEPSHMTGTRYILPFGGGELELFAYSNEDEAARDLQGVDELGTSVNGVSFDFGQPPHFFMRDHVIVLYVGSDTGVLSMLERLCGPQIRGM